jgi:serine protease AprX
MTEQRLHRIVVVLLTTGLAAFGSLVLAPPAARAEVVVTGGPGSQAQVLAAVEAAGGSVRRPLPLVDGVAATIPVHHLADVAHAIGVRSVTPDGRLSLHHAVDGYDASITPGSMYLTASEIGARSAWNAGITGAGVDVALIDSGVAPVAGLDAVGKIMNGPDISFDSQSDQLRYLDAFGHGTHLAGIIAGHDAGVPSSSLATDHDDFAGIAPDARIVNVKVADGSGAADVSQVIAAIDWVVEHRFDNGLNIRVLNLSFGTDGTQDRRLDPLAFAVEVAWRHGIVVVVAAGNSGSSSNGLSDPARDPYVIAVGADDPKGTQAVSDDTVAGFSSWGDAIRNPTLVAPGVSITSLRVRGSAIDTLHPEGRVNTRLFRGSGTSQATAVVSGAVALLAQEHPDATPDQLKSILASTAAKLPNGGPREAQGRGLVKVDDAITALVPATAAQTAEAGTGLGTLEGARGSHHLSQNQVELSGEHDIFGHDFSSPTWATTSDNGTSWSGGDWNGSTWTGSSWYGSSWTGTLWGSSWYGSSWYSSSWSGSTWTGSSWYGSSWTGVLLDSSWTTEAWE